MPHHIKRRPILPALFILTLSFITSCELSKEVKNIPLPDEPRRLVINTFLDPDADSIRVYVGASNPLKYSQPMKFDSWEFPPLPDAQVSIEDLESGVKQLLTYSDSSQTHLYPKSAIPLRKGGKYRVEALHAELGQAHGECTIPTGASVPIRMRREGDALLFTLNIPAEPRRYFYIDILISDFPYQENILLADSKTSHDGKVELRYTELRGLQFESENVYARVWEANESAHAYLDRIIKQRKIEFDPFASPVFPYSNVEGGLGAVGALIRMEELTL